MRADLVSDGVPPFVRMSESPAPAWLSCARHAVNVQRESTSGQHNIKFSLQQLRNVRTDCMLDLV